MKRLLFLSMCILLIGAPMVNAEIITVSADRTAYDGTWDQVVLKIASFEGNDIPASGYALTSISGTWTVDGGMNLLGTSSTWSNKVLNDFDAQDVAAPQSWMDFSTKVGTPTRTGTAPYYVTLTGVFGATPSTTGGFFLGPVDVTPDGIVDDGDGYGFDNTLLGVFYIKHTDTSWVPGATIWSGLGNYARNIGGDARVGIATTVAIVPEPSTLALLGCGLFGLLAYAWRKRK